MNDFLLEELKILDQKGLYRNLKPVEGFQGHRITIDGREVLNFCSNNYLGLAEDPRLVQAARKCMEAQGFGAGASRLVCGHMSAHRRLEEKLASLKESEDCLVFSTGYMANVGILSSICGRGDLILADKLNHASLIDGMRLSGADFKRYPHKDMETLEQFLQQAQSVSRKLIVTDSVFSMDGDVAPLEKIVSLAKQYNAMVMVDEAHALGVLGDRGQGAIEFFGLEGKIDIQMGTLSKAAGSFGGYCCGSKALIDYLINRARSFIYTTGLPPAVAAASLKALEIIEEEPERRQKLKKHATYLLEELKNLGFNTLDSQTPIIPLVVGDSQLAVDFSQKLFEENIFVSAIRPPTVPQNTARLRITVMATHTREDLDVLLQCLEKIGKEFCII